MRRLCLGCFVVAGGLLVAGCSAENLKLLGSTLHTAGEVSDTVSKEGVELADTACPELRKGEIDKLELKGSAAVQAETRAFLGAVHNTLEYAVNVNRTIRARCEDIGVDLGLSRKQLEKQQTGPYGGAEEVCTDTARAFAKTGARVVVHYTPPACSTSLDAVTACLAACGKPLSPAELSASCQGGKLVGVLRRFMQRLVRRREPCSVRRYLRRKLQRRLRRAVSRHLRGQLQRHVRRRRGKRRVRRYVRG